MGRYSIFHDDHEIRGATIIPYRDSINSQNYLDIYTKHGLGTINPDAWYPMQNLVDVFNDIQASGNAVMDFVSIGMKMSENLPLPPEMANSSSIEMVRNVDQAYQYSNRGSDYGYIRGVITSERHVTVHYRVPYPDDLLYGSLYGYAKRFLPVGTSFTVAFDIKTIRMEQGGTETVIHVKW